MAVESSFFERNKYRNYYEGYTKISNAYFDDYHYHYHGLDTSTTSGFIKTPGFGEPFDAEMFQLKANYWYTIYLPNNLAIIAANIPNLTLVMHFDVDVGMYGDDTEYVTIQQIRIKSNSRRAAYYSSEKFYTSGNRTRRYNASIIHGNIYENPIHVALYREEPDMVSNVEEPRNTGFSLEWYFEDSTGKRVDIKQQRIKDNKAFTQLINIIHTAVTEHDVSLDRIWNTAKQYWLDNVIKRDAIQDCDYYPYYDIDQFILLITEMTSPKNNTDDFSYNPHINDSFLETGFNIYSYVARCVDKKVK